MKPNEKNKAVFLDRDGVLNREVGDYIKHPDHFFLNDGIPEALKKFRSENYLLIVITNQSGIAKGIYSFQQLKAIHAKMIKELGAFGIILDEIYYCPHHPLVSNCLCRKPGSLMLEKAIARFNIDPAQSVFIGDAERDMDAAHSAGIRGIRIQPNARIDLLEF